MVGDWHPDLADLSQQRDLFPLFTRGGGFSDAVSSVQKFQSLLGKHNIIMTLLK